MKKNPEIAQVLAKPGTPTAALADSIPGNKITVASDITSYMKAEAPALKTG
jgi:hypothetical protein